MEKSPLDAVATARKFYESLAGRVMTARERVGRPLTYAEKVLFAHLADPKAALPERGKSTVGLRPDRVAMQDATAQMAILQFMTAGRAETAVGRRKLSSVLFS